MLLRKVLRFIEDVRLRIDLQTDIRQAQTRRNFADTDNRHSCITERLERLFAKFTSKRKTVFMKNVAKPLRHSDGAAKENHFAACFMRLADRCFHFFDAAVE